MITTAKSAAFFVAAITTMAVAALFSGHAAFAADATTTTNPVLNFDPRCTSVSRGISLFQVTDQETTNVDLHYTNQDGSDTGTVTLTPGTNNVYTAFANTTDNGKDTYTFTFGANASITTDVNAGTSCDDSQLPPVTPTCIDGSDASNLNVIWNNNSQIVITTKDGLPLCNDLTLYYSTYRMPDNYNGQGFSVGNATSYPQTKLQSYGFTLEANTFGTWIENVPAPDYCFNTQADIYYGPEVTGINSDAHGYHADGSLVEGYGHGTQNIASQIYTRDATQCAPGMGGGNGGGSSTSTGSTGGQGAGTTTAATTMTTGTPVVLPDTGDASQNVLSAMLSLLFGSTGLAAVASRLLRQN